MCLSGCCLARKSSQYLAAGSRQIFAVCIAADANCDSWVQEVEILRQQVSNYDKDKLTLQLTKQRLLQAEKQFKNLEWEKEVLQQRFARIEKERDDLYSRFEASIYELQQKTGLKGMLLEKKVEALHDHLEKKEAQLAEVLAASNLDPQTLSHVRNPPSLALLGAVRVLRLAMRAAAVAAGVSAAWLSVAGVSCR